MKRKCILRSGWDFLGRMGKKFAADHLSAYAAQATFYLMLAVFPFTMLVCMATRLLPFLNEETMVHLVNLVVPSSYRSFFLDAISGYFNQNISSAKIILLIFLIWTASRLIQALMNGFNTAYGINENRSQTTLRLIGCVYTVALCLLFVAMIVMYVLGSRLVSMIFELHPDLFLLELILNLVRNLATPLLLLLIFWLSYAILPSRKPKFREELPGALLTAVVWRGAASLYDLFLAHSLKQYSYVYGSLTGVVMILIWLYTCVYVWFVGAELNQYLRLKREAGAFDKYHIRLPRFWQRRNKQKAKQESAASVKSKTA
ncbi:MAG: YihY/virulence factor BrkB family protein [Oscillospiraceae bacterium]|nr:YihY/virulence factor BrkB family protein [Oscillospiraceae bacterium]